MTRHRTRVRFSRSLRVAAVAVVAAATSTALFEVDIGRSLLLSSAMVAGVPPVFYTLLACALLRGAPLGRRLGWALAACGVYAVLGLVSGVTLALVHPMSLEGALRRALWSFAPAPFVHLLAAPLMLVAWRSRLLPVRLIVRKEPRPGPPVLSRSSALGPASPDWDSVLRVAPPAPWVPPAGAPAPERAVRERDLLPEPSRPVESAPPRRRQVPSPGEGTPTIVGPMTPAPMVAAPAPVAPTAASTAMSAPVAPKAPAPEPAPPAATSPARKSPPVPPLPTVKAPAAPPVIDGEAEPVIRVPFDRIAGQLPPDVFTLPPARLAESLQEPHVLLVPRRLVLPQLGEGAVEVAWALVEGQFPELAFAMPQAEVRRRFPEWVLSLPMDVVVSQVPPDLFRVKGPAADLSGIGDFPAPFTPGPPEPEPAASESQPSPEPTPPASPPPAPTPRVEPPRAGQREATAGPGPIVAPDRKPSAPAPIPPPGITKPVPAPAAPSTTIAPLSAVTASKTRPPAGMPRTAAPASTVVPGPAAPTAVPAPGNPPTATPVASTIAETVVSTAAAASRADGATPATDRECEALAQTLAPGLAPLGAFDWQARTVGGRPLVCFVPPAMTREPIDALAAAAAALVQRLTSWGIEQVTIRTARLACVLTPLGARGCLAATVRRGGSVAMLELLSARAARGSGDVGGVRSATIAFPAVGTVPAAGSLEPRALADAARALEAFGSVAASIAEADGVTPGVYVFAGRDQGVLAGAARAVYDALVPTHDEALLGGLESVVLRRGHERLVVRPLRGRGGAPAVLATAGEVRMAGRAHRAAARAAALLEAR